MARAFGREGAKVFLAGRTPARLDSVAEQIRSAGTVDVSFNLISQGDRQ